MSVGRIDVVRGPVRFPTPEIAHSVQLGVGHGEKVAAEVVVGLKAGQGTSALLLVSSDSLSILLVVAFSDVVVRRPLQFGG